MLRPFEHQPVHRGERVLDDVVDAHAGRADSSASPRDARGTKGAASHENIDLSSERQ
jgi:hypothetical protein